MDLFEYQARDLFESYGVPVLAGIVADTPEEAKAAAEKIGGTVVVKAQVKAGGRGKAGGVKVVKSLDDVKKEATRILGSTLVTHQTGPKGKVVTASTSRMAPPLRRSSTCRC